MKARIVIVSAENRVLEELLVDVDSEKRLTGSRAARLLARSVPGFRCRKGRAARFAGSEVLPVMEAVVDGWRAWRLRRKDDGPAGYEPPLKGRVGAANAAQNASSDRSRGDWEYAIVHSAFVDSREEPNQTPDRERVDAAPISGSPP